MNYKVMPSKNKDLYHWNNVYDDSFLTPPTSTITVAISSNIVFVFPIEYIHFINLNWFPSLNKFQENYEYCLNKLKKVIFTQ
jgi:hypothetical protein